MTEVELKAKLSHDIEDKLYDAGFIEVAHVLEKDLYFKHPQRDFAKTDEALRIRITVDFDGKKSGYITYKGKRLDDVSSTRPEHETSIGDAKTMAEILESLGFVPVMPVVKERRYFDNGRITVCLDDVKDLGRFVEIEKTVEHEDDKDAALAEITDCLEALGGSLNDTTVKSYLKMLEEKRW